VCVCVFVDSHEWTHTCGLFVVGYYLTSINQAILFICVDPYMKPSTDRFCPEFQHDKCRECLDLYKVETTFEELSFANHEPKTRDTKYVEEWLARDGEETQTFRRFTSERWLL